MKFCMVTHLLASGEKDKLRKFYFGLGWEKYRIGNVFWFIESKGLYLSVYVGDI